MCPIYPNDVTRKQFNVNSEDLASIKKTTAPRKVGLYEVFCAGLRSCHAILKGAIRVTTANVTGRVGAIESQWDNETRSNTNNRA